MNIKKNIAIIGLLCVVAVALAACQPGPEGPAGPAGPPLSAADNSCTDCHDDTTRLFAAHQGWEESTHATGTAYRRGTRASCAGCHSSEGFTDMVAAGTTWDLVDTAPSVSSKTNCRTCHEIHTTYTEADFGLASTDAVTLTVSGETFDGGDGNLCANCHQPRGEINETDADGNVMIEEHWGPHHGVQAAMLLGVGGADVDGTAAAHASMVTDTCVTCHMGEGNNHSMEPAVSACTGCHSDATSLDINGLQTDVEEMAEEVEKRLEALGMWDDGEAVEEEKFPEAYAQAMWNYIFAIVEDGSMGVHNPKYVEAMLEAALDALPEVVEP